jgi:hypothetical protein
MLDLDDDDDLDDRTWQEWCGDVLFNPIMWTVIASIAIGVSGLCFYAGVWGLVSGIALLR